VQLTQLSPQEAPTEVIDPQVPFWKSTFSAEQEVQIGDIADAQVKQLLALAQPAHELL
jgi:hypothetical protein